MPYTFRTRSFGSPVAQTKSYTGAPGWLRSWECSSGIQTVYSWRTGDGVGSGNPIPDVTDRPPEGATISEQLAWRRNFINRSLGNIEQRSSRTAPKFFLTRDVGNEFAVSKRHFVFPYNRGTYSNAGMNYGLNLRPDVMLQVSSIGIQELHNSFPDLVGFRASKGLTVSPANGGVGVLMNTLQSAGTAHINSMLPQKTQADLLSSIIELARGDIPGLARRLALHITTIKGLRKKYKNYQAAAKDLGSEYLNVQFGWAPIIRDIGNAIETLIVLDTLLFDGNSSRRRREGDIRVTHLQANNVRGNMSITPIQATGSDGQPRIYQTPYLEKMISNSSGLGNTVGSSDTDFAVSERISVYTTARFTSGIRPDSKTNGYLDHVRDLLGLELTAEVLWELTPWSWLVDWFLNIGNIVENLQGLNLSNVILNYAYSTIRREMSGSWQSRPFVGSTSFVPTAGNFLGSWTSDEKVRIAASPFGFGTALDSLNGSQWAILVALGLARSR